MDSIFIIKQNISQPVVGSIRNFFGFLGNSEEALGRPQNVRGMSLTKREMRNYGGTGIVLIRSLVPIQTPTEDTLNCRNWMMNSVIIGPAPAHP